MRERRLELALSSPELRKATLSRSYRNMNKDFHFVCSCLCTCVCTVMQSHVHMYVKVRHLSWKSSSVALSPLFFEACFPLSNNVILAMYRTEIFLSVS